MAKATESKKLHKEVATLKSKLKVADKKAKSTLGSWKKKYQTLVKEMHKKIDDAHKSGYKTGVSDSDKRHAARKKAITAAESAFEKGYKKKAGKKTKTARATKATKTTRTTKATKATKATAKKGARKATKKTKAASKKRTASVSVKAKSSAKPRMKKARSKSSAAGKRRGRPAKQHEAKQELPDSASSSTQQDFGINKFF